MFNFDLCEKYVINLDHRDDRRAAFYKNISAQGYSRNEFNWIKAVQDDDFGGLGCAKSHLKALARFITNSDKHYCAIFEDDFQFRQSKNLAEVIIQTLDNKSTWDVFLFAGTELSSFNTGCEIQGHELERVFDSATASGYLVSRQYAHILIQNLLESIYGMEKFRLIEQRKVVYHRFALDRTWNRLQSRDSWFCTKPMLGHQCASYSDIEKKLVNYSGLAA